MDSQSKAIESAKKYLTAAASIAGSAMLARTMFNEYLPHELRNYVSSGFNSLFRRVSPEHTIIIQEFEGMNANELFDASEAYLQTRISPYLRRLRASKDEDSNSITLSLDDGEELIECFNGIEYKWLFVSQKGDNGDSEDRWFELRFHKKHKTFTLNSYLPHILDRSTEIKAASQRLKLYMNECRLWSPIDLNHPATFETLAMEADLKKTFLEDLARFVKRKDFYKRVGKAWKRGYLLFGPPGTGKSSLIAAVANYLRFDIYDLNLKQVHNNSTLKWLLVRMSNKSLLVIEDIDCSMDLQNRDEEEEDEGDESNDAVTLSGLLNFVDGLWSTSGEERIIFFTTNCKEKLDPALLRPGRMDMHIHMGYCGPMGFRVLASNYHAVDDHPMFGEIEGLLKEVEATPAEVAEQMMRSDDADDALEGLIGFLKGKRDEGTEGKRGEEEEDKVGNEKEARVEKKIERSNSVVDRHECRDFGVEDGGC